MTIASIPDENGYVEPAPAAWADLNKLTEERDSLWRRVKQLETEGDVELRRRADEAEALIEALKRTIENLEGDVREANQRAVHCIGVNIDLDNALKAAMKLIAYLASQQE